MNDCILIQQVYPGEGYEPMLDLVKDHNQNYCDLWKMDYLVKVENTLPNTKSIEGAWSKVDLIQKALNDGYEYVVWLDADAMIVDITTDLRDACPRGIGACWMRIPQLDHWNVGVLYLRNTPQVKAFVAEWLTGYPGLGDGWNEQGVFNKMGRQSRVVETISDRWNATLNVSMVPDAVVLGFHGCGNAKQRLELMQKTFERLGAK